MLGYERLESQQEVPDGYLEKTSKEEPYPIMIWGESKPIPDNKIGQYINDTFYYYLNIKKFGLPYKNWVDSPKWVLKLVKLFDTLAERFEIYNLNRSR